MQALSSGELPLDLRSGGEVMLGDIRRFEVDYLLEEGLRTSAYVYVKGDVQERAPGVLLWHGHNELGKAGAAVTNPTRYGQFSGALDLARAGFVVLTPDIRSLDGSLRDHMQHTLVELSMGRPALGLYVSNGFRALDVLEQRPEVDPERLGVAGISLGGWISMSMAALDSRIKATVVQGFLGSFGSSVVERLSCPCIYTPGLAKVVDISDLALAAAPTPALFVAGARDREFPIDGAREAFGKIRRGYELLGAAKATSLHVHDGGHQWLSDVAIRWFDGHLGGSTDGTRQTDGAPD